MAGNEVSEAASYPIPSFSQLISYSEVCLLSFIKNIVNIYINCTTYIQIHTVLYSKDSCLCCYPVAPCIASWRNYTETSKVWYQRYQRSNIMVANVTLCSMALMIVRWCLAYSRFDCVCGWMIVSRGSGFLIKKTFIGVKIGYTTTGYGEEFLYTWLLERSHHFQVQTRRCGKYDVYSVSRQRVPRS